MNKDSGRIPVIGILGGGQLGRMLIQNAVNYNCIIHSLDPDPEAPCAGLANKFVNGSFNDYETVLQFGRGVEVLTVEIEHVNTKALRVLRDEGIRVFPQPEVLELIQDKGTQKQFFKDSGFNSSPFVLVENKAEIEALGEEWFPCFQKLRRSGYDGKGVQHLAGPNDLAKAFDEPSVIEKAVKVDTELAVIVASNGKGDIKTFPAVDMIFHPTANLVEFLSAPSALSAEIQKQAEDVAVRIASALKIQGLLAVEFFLDEQGNLLVNELAPRTHNSGHHTIEGNSVSQFDQHLRSILGWPLGSTQTVSPAVMMNLLGEAGHTGEAIYEGIEEVTGIPGVYLHLYGKKFTKPFRKMGHVTITAASKNEAMEKAERVKMIFKVITNQN